MLSNLLKVLIKFLLGLFKALTNSKNAYEILNTIFEETKSNLLFILKNGLKDGLNSLLAGSLSEIKNLIKGKIGKNNPDIISSWTDF